MVWESVTVVRGGAGAVRRRGGTGGVSWEFMVAEEGSVWIVGDGRLDGERYGGNVAADRIAFSVYYAFGWLITSYYGYYHVTTVLRVS